mgnify:CR=1 FL=1
MLSRRPGLALRQSVQENQMNISVRVNLVQEVDKVWVMDRGGNNWMALAAKPESTLSVRGTVSFGLLKQRTLHGSRS